MWILISTRFKNINWIHRHLERWIHLPNPNPPNVRGLPDTRGIVCQYSVSYEPISNDLKLVCDLSNTFMCYNTHTKYNFQWLKALCTKATQYTLICTSRDKIGSTIESRTYTGLATVRCKSEIIVLFVVVSNKNNSGIPVWIVGRPWWSWDLKSWLLILRFFLVVQVLAFIIRNWLMFASFSVLLIFFTGFSGYVYSEHCYWSLISFYWSSWYILPSILLIFFTGVDLSGYVYADNYFELFYNGQLIAVTLAIAKMLMYWLSCQFVEFFRLKISMSWNK